MLTEEEIQDFNNVAETLTQALREIFTYHNIGLGNNIEDLDVGCRTNRNVNDELEYNFYVWLKVKEGPGQKEYGCGYAIPKSEFSKYKFKNKREVETAIAEAIKDYVYGD